MIKNRKYIRFRNKRIISYIFYMRVNKNKKVTKPSEEKKI
jgi:hypothetical protein